MQEMELQQPLLQLAVYSAANVKPVFIAAFITATDTID